MQPSHLIKVLVIALLLTLPATGASAQRLTGPNPTGAVPAPVSLDTTGMFLANFAQVGEDMFIAGQPTERGLRALRDRGVTTIVNLRTDEEMTQSVSFDEAALAASLGIRYVHLPMRGTQGLPYSPEALEAFAKAMRESEGKVLLHCTVAWRASHLWAAYLIQVRGVPIERALAQARLVNLMDEHGRAGESQPLEQFLGRKVPGLGHPPAP